MKDKIYKKGLTGAKKDVEGLQIRDTFWTPNYGIDLLVPFIPKNITRVIEPACGGGKISRRLELAGYTVSEYDIKADNPDKVHNFISGEDFIISPGTAIITNPPFSIKDLFIEKCFEYGIPWAMLINADYSQQQISWIERGCEKLIPKSRISYITPNVVNRVNAGEGTDYSSIEELPTGLLYKYSSAQFHSMWLCWGFNLGKTETFVELSVEQRRTNI